MSISPRSPASELLDAIQLDLEARLGWAYAQLRTFNLSASDGLEYEKTIRACERAMDELATFRLKVKEAGI